MASIFICYATGEGQTAKVADRIAAHLESRGHQTTTVDVEDTTPTVELADYDALIVGASIHAGRHQDAIRSFVTASADALDAIPSAFFQVSLSSATDDPERRADAEGYVADFLRATNWAPDHVALFAGALRYSEYGIFQRVMMKHIAKEATGDTDTSRDYEYTDWADVEAFAEAFTDLLDAEPDRHLVEARHEA